jgi:hypothetical protein
MEEEILEDRDLSRFDENVIKLLEICEKILKVSDKRKISISDRKNPFLTRLEKYRKTYSKTEPDEHVGYFETIYNKNKKFILLGPQRDNWLLDGNIIISYGEECGLKTDIKLHLSAIYNTGCKIRDEVREEIEGLPNATDTSEIGYPATFILLIYRIFREVATSENDKNKLSSHIEKLEGEAGIRSSSGGNELSGLFDMAANMAEQVSGSKIPRDKMPGKNDFGKMLGNLVNDPKTKSLLGGVMEKFKNTENIGDVVKTLVDGVGGIDGGAGGAGGIDGIINSMGNALSGGGGTNPNPENPPIAGEIENNEVGGSVNDEFED